MIKLTLYKSTNLRITIPRYLSAYNVATAVIAEYLATESAMMSSFEGSEGSTTLVTLLNIIQLVK